MIRWLLGLGLLGWSVGAQAAVEEDLGIGSRATAMGGAFVAVADDVSATYYNPAALAALPARLPADSGRAGVHTHVGFIFASPSLWIQPGSIASGALEYGDPQAEDVPDITGVSLGVVLDLQRFFGVEAGLGLLLYMPTQRILYWETPTADAIHWPMYDDRDQHLSILPSVGIRVTERVYLGAGVRLLPEAETDTLVRTEGLGEGQITSGEEATLGMLVSPLLSLYVDAASWLRLGLVFREKINMEDHGQTDITGFVPSAYGHYLSHYFLPRQGTLGASMDIGADALISVEGSYLQWSETFDAYHRKHGASRFQDTFVGRVGTSLDVFGATALMAGYAYIPSPVTDGQGWTNFVDNDKHVVSLGGRTRWLKAFATKRSPVDLSWHLQLHLLRDRQYVKDPTGFPDETSWAANDGSPGYAAGGYMWNIGVSLDVGL